MALWIVCPFCTAEAYTYGVDHLAKATQHHLQECLPLQKSPPPLFKLSGSNWDVKRDREAHAVEYGRDIARSIQGYKQVLEAMDRAGEGEVQMTIRGQGWRLWAGPGPDARQAP